MSELNPIERSQYANSFNVQAQDEWKIAYERGYRDARYQVPAIWMELVSFGGNGPGGTWTSVAWVRPGQCGHPECFEVLCGWEFDPVVASIWFLPCGKYFNKRELGEALEACKEFIALGGHRQ